jgi:hypothetical protein
LVSIEAKNLGALRQTAAGATAGKHLFPKTFIATMPKSGHRGVFKRTTNKRLPIKKIWLPIYNEAERIIKETIDEEASKKFEQYFLHEIQFATGLL